MSSWDEFEQLHRRALEEQGIRTQLNGASHSPYRGSGVALLAGIVP